MKPMTTKPAKMVVGSGTAAATISVLPSKLISWPVPMRVVPASL